MRILLSFMFVFVLALPSWAQQTPPPPRSLSLGKGLIDTVFKEAEKRAIEKFFGKKAAAAQDDGKKSKNKGRGKGKGLGRGKGRGKGMPPGLAKRGSLPPGLQKRLEKHGSLPPGLAKRGLPAGLESQLPKVPEGLERVIAGESIVLLEKATGKILDIIEGVLTKK